MKFLPCLVCVCVLFTVFFQLFGADETFIIETPLRKGAPEKLENGNYSFRLEGAGSALFYRMADRISFRHSREIFSKSAMEMRVVVRGSFKTPVKAWLFIKDKDGLWFQSEKEFQLHAGVETLLSARMDQAGRNFLPVGHSGVWSASEASAPYECGISFWSQADEGALEFECSGESFTGVRETSEFAVMDWRLPSQVSVNEMFESRFRLSREYFNPFDPDEIECNYEIELPGNKFLAVNRSTGEQLFIKPQAGFVSELEIYSRTNTKPEDRIFNLRYPAFFGQDYVRSSHMTRETVTPSGAPYWAFRMTPFAEGKMRIRLHIKDSSTSKVVEYFSPWREVEVVSSESRGPIRRGGDDPAFFEYNSGGLFFPVSLNIHANTDIRSEFKFKWGHLPDRGTRDFDDYFTACAQKGGINLIEIWMASWTYAIEWDAARQYYHGVGRYNTANAWKLDRLLDVSRRNGIYINLVLDSHGKLSFRSDQEWNDNPMNTKGAFASANGAILNDPADYWVDFEAMKMNHRRNRYIAARWGADPNVFAFEFWSEVDLCERAWQRQSQGYMQAWHRNAAKELASMSQAVRLFSTHVCGNGSNTYGWRETTCKLPEMTHIVSDAYRSPSINYVDQTRNQTERLKEFGKPLLVTEFGGTAFGSGESNIVGDIHSGLWASLFLGQSGSPALWWHDFVHIRDHYKHYYGFSEFMRKNSLSMKGGNVYAESIAPRLPYAGAEPLCAVAGKLPSKVTNKYAKVFSFIGLPASYHTAFVSPAPEMVFGWIYNKAYMLSYPETLSGIPFAESVVLPLALAKPGRYSVTFYDTMTGAETHSSVFETESGQVFLTVPPFRVDTAFAVRKIEK